tara:strand:+ start:206 stop:541 length:336 start_codon:yes stop_codon:yes gene_type:complete
MKLLEIDYHRNGMSGRGFYVAIIENYVNESFKNAKFLVTFFPEYDNDENLYYGKGLLTSVVCIDLLQGEKATVAFGINSWRPEPYHDFMVDTAIPQYNKEHGIYQVNKEIA